MGRAIRAIAWSTRTSRLLGVNVDVVVGQTFFLSGALAGAAGALLGLAFNRLDPLMGNEVELAGLTVIIVGGMGSIGGAALAAFLVGMLRVMSVAYLDSSFRDAFVFALLIGVLLMRAVLACSGAAGPCARSPIMFEWIANNSSVINFTLINVALALSIYLTLATGLLSLANAGFMAIGAYTAAILASQAGLPLDVSFVLALVIGGLIALPVRAGRPAPAGRVSGHRHARLRPNRQRAVAQRRQDPARDHWQSTACHLQRRRGHHPAVRRRRSSSGCRRRPGRCCSTSLALVAILAVLRRSHEGRVLAAVRLDESAASTLGINVVRYKLLAFVLGAMMAAGAGCPQHAHRPRH